MLAGGCLAGAPLQPQLAGGWSAVDDLSADGAEFRLASFALSSAANSSTALAGAAVAELRSAQTQVVSGINHRIDATTGSGSLGLLVYEQSWTSTLTLVEATLDDVKVVQDLSLDYNAYQAYTTPATNSSRA